MNRYAVSYIDWFNYKLTTVIVSADDWSEALLKHPEVAKYDDWPETSLGDCKQMAFDQDCMIECVLIPKISR